MERDMKQRNVHGVRGLASPIRYVRDDVKELMPHVYLTLNAIIQSVALSELLQGGHRLTPISFAMHWSDWAAPLQVAAVLQLILLAWVFGSLDSYIPFLLGVAEIGVVTETTSGHLAGWCWWMSIFFAMSLLAYLNMYYKVTRDRGEQALPSKFRQYRAGNILFVGTAAIAFAVMARTITATPRDAGFLFAVLNAVWLAFNIRGIAMWRDMLAVRTTTSAPDPEGATL
jgi:hypothetical protein